MMIDLALVKSKLFTSVISDALDSIGVRNQAMRPFVRPLDDNAVMVGFARTGLYAVRFHATPEENPYEVEIALVDNLRPDDVAVFACHGPTERIAPWGGLLTTAAVYRRAAGCVTDGLARDVRQIRALGFPVFCGGIGPIDSKGRGMMVEKDGLVECAGVRVETGDLVFGDADGVVVVPKAVTGQVIEAALRKVEAERHTSEELSRGAPLAKVFARYGIL
jgi:regulator of RNase E activity RraA